MQALEGEGRPPYSLTHPHPRPHDQSLTGQNKPPSSEIKDKATRSPKSAIFNIY